MPVNKSLSKIKKNLQSKGKKTTLHPAGRKFKQLTRATLRDEKVSARKRAHNERRSNELARVKFVQDVINSDSFRDRAVFDFDTIVIFIRQFIERDDDELDELIEKRRANRPPSNKQLILQSKKNLELEEFARGFLVPDLTTEQNVTFLRNWNGDFGSMSTLKLIRVNSDGKQVVGGTNQY